MSNLYYNPILDTDSYKLSQFLQYPPGMTNLSSYIEARKGGAFSEVTFFGLQAHLKSAWSHSITKQMVIQARDIAEEHGEPFNDAWFDVAAAGYLPLEIEALPEGIVVPCGTPLVQIKATHPDFGWLVSPQETRLLRGVWYPSTVATYSREVKKVLIEALRQTADSVDGLPYMLHDFGARGVSSYESSLIGGAAHLVNFMGTDTAATLAFVMDVYGSAMPGFSVPAAEHSTITSWGESGEAEAYRNMLAQFGNGNIVSIVADSYDLFNAVDNIFGGTLKAEIEAMPARLVVRPDSGEPVAIVAATVKKLGDAFGYTINSKGYKVLNPKVRVLQGDGVNLQSIVDILEYLALQGWSSENVVFGMGGALLQQQNRDTLRFAMKASAVEINGVWQDVYKRPATDLTKSSKAGMQSVIYHHLSGEIITMRRDDYLKFDQPEHWEQGDDLLQPVWRNGELLIEDTFDMVRKRANFHL